MGEEIQGKEVLERRIGDLTVRIDRLLCVGFADCIDEAPEAFMLDADGVVSFTPEPAPAERQRLIRACDACPVDALTVLDETGKPLTS